MSERPWTPGPWIWGHWTIHDEDRAAQRRGEPFWTFLAGELDDDELRLARGPVGRKAKDTDDILSGGGPEYSAIWGSGADKRLIAAAPDLYEALERLCRSISDTQRGARLDSDLLNQQLVAGCEALAKARGE